MLIGVYWGLLENLHGNLGRPQGFGVYHLQGVAHVSICYNAAISAREKVIP